MAVILDQLPIPQSRAEEFLEYLCRNGAGVGSGGGSGLTEAQIHALIAQALSTLELKISDDETTLELVLTNQVLASVDLMTEAQVQDIINQFN